MAAASIDDRLEELAADAARLGGLPVLQVVVQVDALPPRAAALAHREGFVTAALAGPAVEGLAPAAREALAEALGASPAPGPLPALLARVARRGEPRPAPAAVLRALDGRVRDPRVLALPVVVGRKVVGAVRAVVPARDAAGAQERLAAAARVFSLHLAAERERSHLAHDRATYKAFLENAGDAVLVVDPETGRVLEANARALELTRCRPSELTRLTVGRLLARPSGPSRKILAHLASGNVVRDDELLFRPKTGPPIPVSVTTSRIGVGDAPVLHVVIRDLTRERAALAALAQAKETLAALALAGTHLQEETEREKIFEVISRELSRLGFRATILVSRPTPGGQAGPLEIVHLSYPPEMLRVVERLVGEPLAGRRIDPARVPLLRRVLESGATLYTNRPVDMLRDMFGGTMPRPILARVAGVFGLQHTVLAPLRFEGGVSGVLVVAAPSFKPGDAEAIDAFALQASIALEKARLYNELKAQAQRLESEVERRTRELTLAVRALKEIDRRKDNFLANVSHELRTPLVTILGYTQILLSEKIGPLTRRQREALEVSLGNGRRLKDFIEELLDFSRFELTKDRMKFARFDVREPIAQAIAAMAPKAYERGLRLRARVSPRTPLAWGDRERIVQVLTNLLQNAERYCGERGRIRISAARGRNGHVEVSVTDDGAGIAPEHLGKIFDRLYQAGDANRERAKGAGLGLGLNIVKSIVEAHGGRVHVKSRLGHGTAFRFAIPSAELLEPEMTGRARPAAS